MSDKRRKEKYSYDKEYISNKKGKNKKSRHIFLKIVIVLLMIIAILLGIFVGYGYNMLKNIDYDGNIDKSEIQVNEGVETTGYKNILLFGVDSRDQKESYEDGSLSDVIMIVSINQDTKKVKIASVYRDTYLQNTKTKKFDKITHAFGSRGTCSFYEHD